MSGEFPSRSVTACCSATEVEMQLMTIKLITLCLTAYILVLYQNAVLLAQHAHLPKRSVLCSRFTE